MEQQTKTDSLFLVECPRLNRGVKLEKQTWENHILPEHPELKNHLELVKSTIEKSDEHQSIWYKVNNPKKLCIVKQVPAFSPYNKFILIALETYSDSMALVTSVYPVDELPSTGMKLL